MAKEGSPRRLAGLNPPGARSHYGETELDAALFPSIKSVGDDASAAAFNRAFLRSFKNRSMLHRFQRRCKSMHSSRGSIAILAAFWLLEQNQKFNNSHNQVDLVGDGASVHAPA